MADGSTGTATDYREREREIPEGDMNRVEIQIKREILVENNGDPWWVTAITGSRTTRHLGPIIITPTTSNFFFNPPLPLCFPLISLHGSSPRFDHQ